MLASFGHNSSNQLVALLQLAGGATQNPLLGYNASNPLAAVSWGGNHVSVFFSARPPYYYRNVNVLTWNGATWSIEDLGGEVPAGERLAAVSWGSGHMAVFHRGTDDKLYVKQYSASSWSSSWTDLGSGLRGDPVAASLGLNKLVVCAPRDNGVFTSFMCRVYESGSWGSWLKAVDTTFVPTSYQVVSSSPGTFTVLLPTLLGSGEQVMTRNWDGAVWDLYFYGTGIPASAKILDAISRGQGSIDVVWRQQSTYTYQDPSGSTDTYEMGYPLQHSWYYNDMWQTEAVTSSSSPVLGARLVSPTSSRLDVFFDRVTCFSYCTANGGGHLYATGNPPAPPSQLMSNVVVTVGSYGPTYGYNAGIAGSASPGTTVNGRTYKQIYDWFDYWNGIDGVAFTVCGFGVNPGSNWLTSISTSTTTKYASQALYSYGAAGQGCAMWSWENGMIGLPQGIGQTAQIQVVHH